MPESKGGLYPVRKPRKRKMKKAKERFGDVFGKKPRKPKY